MLWVFYLFFGFTQVFPSILEPWYNPLIFSLWYLAGFGSLIPGKVSTSLHCFRNPIILYTIFGLNNTLILRVGHKKTPVLFNNLKFLSSPASAYRLLALSLLTGLWNNHDILWTQLFHFYSFPILSLWRVDWIHRWYMIYLCK